MNPGNLPRAMYAGDANASDSNYNAGKGGGGDNYTGNAGNAHTALKILSDWDPTPASTFADGALTKIEGEHLHKDAMEKTDPRLKVAAQYSEDLSNGVDAIKVIKNAKRKAVKGALGVADDQAGKTAGKTGRAAPPAPPAGGTSKKVKVDASKSPESAKHLEDTGATGTPLEVNRKDKKQNRADALRGKEKVKGKDLDESPPAVLRKPGDPVSVRPIASGDNKSAGAQIGNQIRDVPDGGTVEIEITNKAKNK